MKKSLFFAAFIMVFIAEIVTLIIFACKPVGISQDTVKVNEVVQSVAADFYNLDNHKQTASLDYAVIDNDGKVLYKTKQDISDSINKAISHMDSVVDIVRENVVLGKVIIYNDAAATLQLQKKVVITAISVALIIECGICLGYALYMQYILVKPFKKLKGFALRVAGGNLDIPLEMDRRNVFGAFTESFDIMRSELKKARLAEAEANRSKKELVAKLSHDIKTPVASIKAVSEVGLTVSKSAKDRENYSRIIEKSDQINALITNLFTATIEELHQLTVAPCNTESAVIEKLLVNADYLRRAQVPHIFDCVVYIDKLRLQQVFDNIFANSYKYANTAIDVKIEADGEYLAVTIEDYGGGVAESELPALKEKFRRGAGSAGVEGAGLGLYISDYFMKEMHGALDLENGAHGLIVTVKILRR